MPLPFAEPDGRWAGSPSAGTLSVKKLVPSEPPRWRWRSGAVLVLGGTKPPKARAYSRGGNDWGGIYKVSCAPNFRANINVQAQIPPKEQMQVTLE